MANNGIYGGGIPDNGINLYPKSASGSDSYPDYQPGGGGLGRIDAKPGSAPTMNGSYEKSFIDDASYQGDLSIDNDPKMKICSPSDISNSGSGKMSGC